MRPKNEFGKPKRLDCHDLATLPHETTALISQANFPPGVSASFIASYERTRDAIRLRVDETSIAQ
jgi:hypothetical protein